MIEQYRTMVLKIKIFIILVEKLGIAASTESEPILTPAELLQKKKVGKINKKFKFLNSTANINLFW